MVLHKTSLFILSLSSTILISVGAITITTLPNPYIGLGLAIAGAVGVAVREWIKTQPTD